jgi:hypothetical protein
MRKDRGNTTVILGAGASRGVSYARSHSPSPLDCDFFEILAHKIPRDENLRDAVGRILDECYSYPPEERLYESMERAFYTMHLNRVIRAIDDPRGDVTELFLGYFATCIEYLLREAHGKRICQSHKYLFQGLTNRDAIVTFNYDLVIERALGSIHRSRIPFGTWIYGGSGEPPPTGARRVPSIYKLHGSSNWQIEGDRFVVHQQQWIDFDKQPGYRGHKADDLESFPIQLPYWEKRIEALPWRLVWAQAFARLVNTRNFVVWGYSMPETDIKAREFLRTAFDRLENAPTRLCVIDPNVGVRQRWRRMFYGRQFWQYSSFEEFRQNPPDWWPS